MADISDKDRKLSPSLNADLPSFEKDVTNQQGHESSDEEKEDEEENLLVKSRRRYGNDQPPTLDGYQSVENNNTNDSETAGSPEEKSSTEKQIASVDVLGPQYPRMNPRSNEFDSSNRGQAPRSPSSDPNSRLEHDPNSRLEHDPNSRLEHDPSNISHTAPNDASDSLKSTSTPRESHADVQLRLDSTFQQEEKPENVTLSNDLTTSYDGDSHADNENSNRARPLYSVKDTVQTDKDRNRSVSVTTVSIERNNFSVLDHSRLSRRRVSRKNLLSRGSNYYHGDYIDENLLITSSKLDATLLRLFSPTHGDQGSNTRRSSDSALPFMNYAQSDLINMDAVTWRLRPMDAVHRETLDHDMELIEENLGSKEVIRKLYDQEVLTHLDYSQLIRMEGQGDRAVTRLLVKTLQRRGDKAYPTFMKVLGDLNYTRLKEHLSATEGTLRSGMMEDRREMDKKIEMETFRTAILQSADFKSPESTRFTYDSPPPDEQTVNSQKLEQHLNDLNMELKALHEDVTALKSARQGQPKGETTESSQVDTAQNTKPRETTPKSSSCSIV